MCFVGERCERGTARSCRSLASPQGRQCYSSSQRQGGNVGPAGADAAGQGALGDSYPPNSSARAQCLGKCLGLQVFTSYIDLLYPTDDRNERLRDSYFFTCQCLECTSQDKVSGSSPASAAQGGLGGPGPATAVLRQQRIQLEKMHPRWVGVRTIWE